MDETLNESLDLSNLIAMLEKMLEATNITKKSIFASLFNVRKLLKDWCLPDARESVPPTCICFDTQVNDDMNIEEIAKDIEDVVGSAQKLRGLGLGLHSKKHSPRVQPVCNQLNTCRPRPTLSSQMKPVISSNNSKISQDMPRQSGRSNSTLRSQTNGRPNPTRSRSSSQIGLKPENKFTARPKQNCTLKQRNTTKGIARPLSSGSASTCSSSNRSSKSLQSTYQKDFTPSASPRFSNIPSKVNATAGSSISSLSLNTVAVSATITMAQLDALLNRVSIDCRPTAKDPDSLLNVPSMDPSPKYYTKQVNEECLIHGKAIPLNRKMSQTWVDFREAIDRLGVPSELVKILKLYHIFVDKLQHQDDKVTKETKVSNLFLKRINSMNRSRWDEAMCEPLVSLFSDYTTLFKEPSRMSKLSKNNALNFRVQLDALEQRYRKCSSQNISFPSESNTVQSDKVVPNKEKYLADWALTGIWNAQTIESFKVMDETLCIRYNNVQQLTSFQENMQLTQRLQYQNRTLEIIREDILPHMTNMCLKDPLLIPLFKTVAALCDIKNLTLPIFVKSPEITDTMNRFGHN